MIAPFGPPMKSLSECNLKTFVIWNIMRTRALLQNQQTMGSNCARTLDVTHWTGTQLATETRVAYDTFTWHAINTGYINSTKETSFATLCKSPWWSLCTLCLSQKVHQGCLFCGVNAPCIYRKPGGVIVGDSGLCCCVPVQCVTSIVRA